MDQPLRAVAQMKQSLAQGLAQRCSINVDSFVHSFILYLQGVKDTFIISTLGVIPVW